MKKWTTISIYVNIETGEILPKYLIQTKQYNIINKIKKHEYNKDTESGRTTITNECRRSTADQQQLF